MHSSIAVINCAEGSNVHKSHYLKLPVVVSMLGLFFALLTQVEQGNYSQAIGYWFFRYSVS